MTWTKLKQFFWGTARVQLYVLCVAGAFAYASFAQAYGSAERSLGELGFEMLSNLGSLQRGVERVQLNGQTFTFAATTLAETPSDVVAEFEERCKAGSGSLAQDLAGVVAFAKEHGKTLPDPEPSHWLTRSERAERQDSAHASCFVRPNGDQDHAAGGIWSSLSTFAETGKLSALGGFRYVRADRQADAEVTRVLAVMSDGDFDFMRLLPDLGDAEGSDPRLTQRPEGSVRRFSARVVRSGQGAYVYSTQRAPAEVLQQYDRSLSQRGLLRAPLVEQPNARAYAAGDGAVIISVTEERGERSVAIFELGKLDAKGGNAHDAS